MNGPIQGLMQDDFPLTLHTRGGGCVTATPRAGDDLTPDGVVRASYGEVCERVDRLARVLERLGIGQGDRVGTFAWNNQRHFELYMAVPCIGAVLHTLNIRLFAEQLTYIVNHAEDQVIFVDDSLVPLLEPLAPTFEGVRHFVVMGDPPADPDPEPRGRDAATPPCRTRCATRSCSSRPGPGAYDYPELDERQAAALCYTSGTTGNPKGVLYSHRSICLHATATLMADDLASRAAIGALVVVPMFHANAWGLPHGGRALRAPTW